jgi:hypothetical protein
VNNDPFDWQQDRDETSRLDEEATARSVADAAEQKAALEDPEYAAYVEQRNYDFAAIAAAIDPVQSYGLSVEILYWAMDALKSNPAMTIGEAINYGFYEWVK